MWHNVRSKWRGILAVAVILCVVGTLLGHWAGKGAGERAKARLQLVIPSFDRLPNDDRALLVGLAMTCRLEDRPAQAREVVACLREAATDPHAFLPKSVDKAAVPGRLEQLLPGRV